MISFIEHSGKRQNTGTENRWLPRMRGGGRVRLQRGGSRDSVLAGDKAILCPDCDDGYMNLHAFTEPFTERHIPKKVNFTAC